jgi:hypothetical protein
MNSLDPFPFRNLKLPLLCAIIAPVAAALLSCAASTYILQSSTNWIHDPWNVTADPTGGDTVVYVGMTSGPCTNGRCADFDTIMRNFLTNNAHVYVGPGTFQTKGVWDGNCGQTDATGFRVPSDCWLTGFRTNDPPVSCTDTNYSKRFRLSCLPSPYNVTILQLADIRTTNLNGAAPANIVLCTHTFGNDTNLWTTNIPPNNICVTNLNLDCNGTFLSTNLNQGLWIAGVRLDGRTNMHAVGINVYDATACPSSETFILETSVPFGGVGSGHMIQNCSVRHVYNPTQTGQCSAITLNEFHGTNDPASWVSGTVEGCYVELNRLTATDAGAEFAYNGHNLISAVYRGNNAIGAVRSFNNDTFPNLLSSWIDNKFDVPWGCYGYFLPQGTAWSRISGNTLTVRGPPPLSCNPCSGIAVCGPTPPGDWGDWPAFGGSSNLLVDANIFLRATNTDTASYALDLHLSDSTGRGYWSIPFNIDVEKNIIWTNLNNHAPTNLSYSLNWTTNTGTISTNPPSGSPSQPNLNWVYTPYRCDFDQNGSVDLVLENTNSTNVVTWAMNGTNVLATNRVITPSPYQPGCTWRVVGVGDIDRDGRTDLLWEDTNSTVLAFWTMNKTSPTSYKTVSKTAGIMTWPDGTNLVYVGTGTRICALTDFNYDGHPDLVVQWTDTNTYNAGVWFMKDTMPNGQCTWFQPTPGPGYPWKVVGTGDFDGNGKVDLLFQNQNSSTLGLWFMDGITLKGSPNLNIGSPDQTNWVVVATGDFNHDNKVDIAFQDSNQDIHLWLMNGTNRVTSLALVPSRLQGYEVMGPR